MKTDITLVDMVARLQKPGEEILASLTPFKCNLWHHGMGLAGEFIELHLAILNNDRDNFKEEAGDFIFFAQGILTACAEVLHPKVDISVERLTETGCLETAVKHRSFGQATDKAVDLIKKHIIYGKDFDPVEIQIAVTEALGFLIAKAHRFSLTVEEVIEHNKAKLAVRYNGFVYSDQAAKDRKDKQ